MTRFTIDHNGTHVGLFDTFGDALDHLRGFHPNAVFDLKGGVCHHGFAIVRVTV